MSRTAVLWIALAVFFGQALSANALDPHRTLSQYGHQQWQSDTGLPQDSVRVIQQSADGYIWLATNGGLVRFNGFSFSIFNTENTPQMQSNVVRSITQDRSGTLWIGTANGLLRYHNHHFQAFNTASGLPSNIVWLVHQDRVGRLWAGTSAGLAVMIESKWKPLQEVGNLHPDSEKRIADAPDGSIWFADGNQLVHLDAHSLAPKEQLQVASASEISAIACDAGGDLWVGTQQGLEIYRQGHLTPVVLNSSLRGIQINTILPTAPESAWVGTSQGLYFADLNQKTIPKPVSALLQGPILTLLRDREGTLWVGTDHGVARLQQPEKIEEFPADSDLPVSTIDALYEDREGNLWIGSETEGLTILRDQKFTTFTKRQGLSGDMVTSIYGDHNSALWIGTDGAGLNRMTGKGVAQFSTANGLSSNVILALAADQHGNMWVGTPSGLNRMHGSSVKIYNIDDGLADDFVRSLFVDHDGSLWVGTRHGLAHMSGEHFVNYSSLDGLGSDFVGAILRTHDGSLWVGTSGGLSLYHNGSFTTLTTKDGLSNNVITAMHEDAKGTLWLGTNGGGLNRLQNHVVHPVAAKALPQIIYGILQDDSGNLWLSSPTGVYRIDHTSLDPAAAGTTDSRLQVRAFGPGDGMKTRECSGRGHPEAWKQPDGSLWFATVRGVASIVPEHLAQNLTPPETAIESVLIDDRPADQSGTLVLQPGKHRVEFQYAGLSFAVPQLVSYRYRLEGYDRGWMNAGHARSAYYTNLPPGRYTFQVLSANNDGVWDKTPAEISFRIRPYFYQTIWFYLILGLSVCCLGSLAYWWNLRRVQTEFNAVLGERNRIAREIHDTLAQDIVSISLQLEVVSRLLGGPVQNVRDQLDRTRELVKRSLVDARSSIWALRSQDRQHEDLPARLSAGVQELGRDAAAQVRFDVQGTYRPISRKTEDELLRIGKEAAGNAVRHAEASRIEVKLLYDTDTVCLRIEDDGKGFDPAKVAGHQDGHFGLQGMKERATEIHASFQIESQPGSGTRVSVGLKI